MTYDPNWSSVIAADHLSSIETSPIGAQDISILTFEGDDSSTIFTDWGGHPTGVSGQARIKSNAGYFGTNALLVDAATSWVDIYNINSSDLILSGDFTIEFRFKQTTLTTNAGLFELGLYTNGINLQINTGSLQFYLSNATPVGGQAIALNTWYHLALSRTAGTLLIFLNGQAVQSIATAAVFPTAAANARLGCCLNNTANQFYGYISDFRIRKGQGIYLQNFTVPASAYPDVYSTDLYFTKDVLLLHGEGTTGATNATVLDSSSFANTITKAGEVAQGSFSPYPPALGSVYDANTNIGSLFFDGSGDYLSIPNSVNFDILGDFTIEFWCYVLAYDTAGSFILNKFGGGFQFYIGVNGSVNVAIDNVSANILIAPAGSFTLNAWTHWAATRSGNTWRLFKNGALLVSATATTPFVTTTGILGVGLYETNTNYELNGFISDLHVIKGFAKYTGIFVPPTAPVSVMATTDIYATQVSLLMHMIGTPGSVTFNEPTGKTITVGGNTSVSWVAQKYGNGSAYFDGSGDSITVANHASINLSTGDFTAECWFYCLSSTNDQSLLFGKDNVYGISYASYSMYMQSNGGIGCSVGTGNGTGTNLSIAGSAAGVSLATWHHVAMVRTGNSLMLFLDGTQVGTTQTIVTMTDGGKPLTIGNEVSAASRCFNGYIQDLRITKGVARYTTTFAPPSALLPDIGFTVLLLKGNNSTVKDYAAKSTVGFKGAAAVSTVQSKFGGSSLLTGPTTADYVYLANTNLDLGISNVPFTIEAWVYPSGVGTQMIFAKGGGVDAWNSTTGIQYQFFIFTGTVLYFQWWNGSAMSAASGGTVPASTWSHLAVAFDGSMTRIFINGVAIAGTAAAYAKPSSSRPLGFIGIDQSGVTVTSAYIDELRITNGVCRYGIVLYADIPPLVPVTHNDVKSNAFWICKQPVAAPAQYAVTGGSLYFNLGPYLKSKSKTLGANMQTSYTIDFWVKFESLAQTNGIGLFFIGDISSNSNRIQLLATSAGTLQFYSESSTSVVNWSCESSAGTVAVNVWYFITIVKDTSGSYIYVNGILVASLLSTTNYPITIGHLYIGAARGNSYLIPMSGWIQDFRIANGVARSFAGITVPTQQFTEDANTLFLQRQAIISAATQDFSWPNVTGMMKFYPVTPGVPVDPYRDYCIASMDFEGVVGKTAVNDGPSAGGYTLQYVGNCQLVSPGKFGSTCLNLGGTISDYATYSGYLAANVDFAYEDSTIELWFNLTADSTKQTNTNPRAALVGTLNSTPRGWSLCLDGSGNTTGSIIATEWRNSVTPGASNGDNVSIPTGAVNKGQWYHLVWSVENGQSFFFLDGQPLIGRKDMLSYPLQDSAQALRFGQITVPNWQYAYNGKIDEFRMYKGKAKYSCRFTVPTANPDYRYSNSDTLAAYIILGMRFEGTAGDLTTLEEKSHTVSMVNGAVLSATQSRYGGTSLYLSGVGGITYDEKGNAMTYTGDVCLSSKPAQDGGVCAVFDGAGDYLTVTSTTVADLSTGDFTLEFYVHPVAATSFRVCGRRPSNGYMVGIAAGSLVSWNQWSSGAVYETAVGPAPTLNAWNHIAIVRTGSSVTVFTNGVGGTPVTMANAPDATAAVFTIGRESVASATGEFNGYMRDFRLTKGTARYSTTFTPPATMSYRGGTDPYWANVVLSIPMKTSTALVFDNHADFNFGSGDFCIEFWFWTAVTGAYQTLVCFLYGVGNTAKQGLLIRIDSNNKLSLNVSVDGSTWTISGLNSYNTVPVSQWNHLAVSRKGSVFCVYMNGSLEATAWPKTGAINFDSSCRMLIGAVGAGVAPFTGYIDDLRITKGMSRYSAAFTPDTSAANSASWPNPMYRGPKGNGWTRAEDLAAGQVYPVTQERVVKNGATSMSFNVPRSGMQQAAVFTPGNTDYVFGLGEFTLEGWYYPITYLGNPVVLMDYHAAAQQGWQFSINTSGMPYFYSNAGTVLTGTVAVTLNAWNHMVACRKAGVLYLFVNGVLSGSVAYTGNLSYQTTTLGVGAQWSTRSTPNDFRGYIDSVRITKGVGRYSAPFTPPASEFLEVGYDLDNTPSRGVTYNAYGSVIPEDSVTKLTNRALRFDGNGGYAKLSHSSLGFNLADFTVECWVRPEAFGTYDPYSSYVIALFPYDANFNSVVNGYTMSLNTGSPSISTSIKKFGAGSLVPYQLYGAPWPLGNLDTDFCIDIWFYTTSTASQSIFAFSTGGTDSVRLRINATGAGLGAIEAFGGGSTLTAIPPGGLSLSTWYHLAVSKSGTTLRLFLNGVLFASGANTGPWNMSATGAGYYFFMGCNSASGNPYSGYLDDFRVTKGVPRYVANFTPPQAAASLTYTEASPLFGSRFGAGTNRWNVCLGGSDSDINFKHNVTTAWVKYISGGAASFTPVNTWTHVALVRNGDNLHLFAGGKLVGTKTGVTAWNFAGTDIYFGGSNDGTNNMYLQGIVDGIRISSNARYLPVSSIPSDLFTASSGAISGIVRDDTGTPCSRKVNVHSRATGTLIASGYSDAVTGAFTFGIGETAYVIVLDDAAGIQYNAIVYDNVAPV